MSYVDWEKKGSECPICLIWFIYVSTCSLLYLSVMLACCTLRSVYCISMFHM
uniref:Transmembrane protein n=1 Tax=Medicago truncatula TaxID=3880 RepID=I3SDL4_MEDTR|nr:unknown [Medicago truncatula]AFK46833.1 unknown [Medicago truncatula]